MDAQGTTTRTIRLIIEVTREADDSFSVSVEDEHFGATDERYVGGISEGLIFTDEVTREAGIIVAQYLGGVYERIMKPMEFKKVE